MRFNSIPLQCDCGGRIPGRIRQVGLTAQHELLIHWRCPGCKRTHLTIKALSDCWRDCPNPWDEQQFVPPRIERLLGPDAQFLHSMGVSFPEDEEN